MPVLGAVHYRVEIGDERRYFDKIITEEDVDMPRDKLEALVGDGQARVTCSFDLSDKDFGAGFGAHCSVSLTVNQSEDDVDRAADIASSLACRYTEEAVGVATALFQSTIGRRKR